MQTTTMSLEDIPQNLADALGINLGTAQALLSASVILMVILPILILTARREGTNGTMISIFMFLLVEAFLVGAGWLPFWILIATITLMAMGVAALGTQLVTGSK